MKMQTHSHTKDELKVKRMISLKQQQSGISMQDITLHEIQEFLLPNQQSPEKSTENQEIQPFNIFESNAKL